MACGLSALAAADTCCCPFRYETTNHLWLILEYCVGGDLMSLLRQDVRLPESSVHDFARDLVTALQFLHSKEIIYCDLKPSNILLDENGRMKLGGFGLSRRLADINKKPLQSLPQVGGGLRGGSGGKAPASPASRGTLVTIRVALDWTVPGKGARPAAMASGRLCVGIGRRTIPARTASAEVEG